MSMNYLHFLFLIIGQSVLFAQTDSTKKKFKPYGLIDAAPVAISKDDFKPQITMTIHSVDATTSLPLDALIDYYTFGDSSVTAINGKVVSFHTNGNEKIILVSNASGYFWQTRIFNTPISDTSYVLKFQKIRKGDEITLHNVDFNLQYNNFESFFYADLLGLKESLKLNPGLKIQIFGCPKGKEEVFFHLIKNNSKKRIRIKSFSSRKQTTFETITIKILNI